MPSATKKTWLAVGVSAVSAFIILATYSLISTQITASQRRLEKIERLDALTQAAETRNKQIEALTLAVESEKGLLIFEVLNPDFKTENLVRAQRELEEIERILGLASEQCLYVLTSVVSGLNEIRNESAKHEELANQLLKSADELIAKASGTLERYRKEAKKPNPFR